MSEQLLPIQAEVAPKELLPIYGEVAAKPPEGPETP